MNSSVLFGSLVVVAVAASLAALALALLAYRAASGGRRGAKVDNLPTDVGGLRGEVGTMREQMRTATRHLGLVRYDAFADMGGRLSWSLALLTDGGDGVVLTSIHGRAEARSYAKDVAGWGCPNPLSPEEEEAIKVARET